MDNITGFLIRYARLQQNLSQEGLCKGICVVSYLSKIEQGSVNASKDIIHALFKQLHITYQDDTSFIEKHRKLIKQYFEQYFFQEHHEDTYKIIQNAMDQLLYSSLIIEVLLVEVYEMNHKEEHIKYKELMEKLKIFEPYMKEKQLFLYYIAYDFKTDIQDCFVYYKKAGNIINCSIQKFYLGSAYYHMGENAQANVYFQQAYQLASEEGNVVCMLDCALFLGNSYSNLHEEVLMRKHYQQCIRLAQALKRNDILASIYYNIGSSLLQWGQMEEAEKYLLQSIQMHHEDSLSLALNYQKLALLYRNLHKEKEMERYKILADQEMLNISDPYIHKMNDFVHLYCEKERNYDEHYLNLLIQLTQICPDEKDDSVQASYGFRIFHAQYLQEAFQKMRRYKEALQVKEALPFK